ncbi:Hypothetical predicted protein, partial [Pelobates cultripes]
DSIANNYSPAARDFSTHYIYKLNNSSEYSEAGQPENLSGLSYQKPPYQNLRIVKKRDLWNTLWKPK